MFEFEFAPFEDYMALNFRVIIQTFVVLQVLISLNIPTRDGVWVLTLSDAEHYIY